MSATSQGVDVLVVGAGPTGLVMACELARRGVSFRLIDELPAATTISKAAGVQARMMEVWDSMGFAESVLPHARLIRGLNVFSGGKRVAHIPIHGMDSPFPHIYGISQRDVELLLTEHLAKLGGRIERSVKLENFTQDAEGVSSTLIGPGGATEVLRTGWVAGCDGSHSRVRHILGFAFEGAPYEEKIIQGDVQVQLPLAGVDDEIVVVLGEGTVLALFPLFKDGRYRLVVIGGPEGAVEEPTLDDFQRALDARLPGAKVSDPAWMVSFRIHHRHVDRYQQGRAFISGDACHIHSPVGGQGMNTGMQDAFNLAWKLALVCRGKARPSLLDTYGPERMPIAHALVGRTDKAMSALEGAITFHNPVSVAMRNSLMSFVTSLSFVQKRATRTLSMLEQNYRGSVLSAQDRGSVLEGGGLGDWAVFGDGPAPGDRAPDSPAVNGDGQATTLHRLFRAPHFQLLLFAGPSDSSSRNSFEIARRVQERVGDEVVVHQVVAASEKPPSDAAPLNTLLDPEGVLHKRYGARSECLYLLRPDGYVSYRSHPADGDKLLAHLERIFV